MDEHVCADWDSGSCVLVAALVNGPSYPRSHNMRLLDRFTTVFIACFTLNRIKASHFEETEILAHKIPEEKNIKTKKQLFSVKHTNKNKFKKPQAFSHGENAFSFFQKCWTLHK